MALCNNSASLLELAFGVNAVLAVLSSQVSATKSRLTDMVIKQFQEVDSTFELSASERPTLENWVSLTFKGFKFIKIVSLAPQILALALILISIGTLYQAAIWGDKCFIEDTTLAWITLISLFVAPILYYLFPKIIEVVERKVSTKSFVLKTNTGALLAFYRLSLKTKEQIKQNTVILDELDQQEAERLIKKFLRTPYHILHPLRWGKKRIQTWRVNRLRQQLKRGD